METTRKDTTNNLGPIRKVEVVIPNHKPSWKRYVAHDEQGWAQVEFTLGDYTLGDYTLGDYSSGTQLSIDALEGLETASGRDITKRVMISIDENAARQLYAMLHERFGGN